MEDFDNTIIEDKPVKNVLMESRKYAYIALGLY